jgi:hypothetical protein
MQLLRALAESTTTLIAISVAAGTVDTIVPMRLRPASRALASWFAILAILMAALAPAVSHALAVVGSQAWVEVCSASGSKRIQSDSPSGSRVSGDPAAQGLEHCPYCTPQGESPALPTARPAPTLRVALGLAHLTAFVVAPQTAPVWQSAQPRTPPPRS